MPPRLLHREYRLSGATGGGGRGGGGGGGRGEARMLVTQPPSTVATSDT